MADVGWELRLVLEDDDSRNRFCQIFQTRIKQSIWNFGA